MESNRKSNVLEAVNHENEMLVEEGSREIIKTWNILRNMSIHFESYKDVSFEAENAWVKKVDWDGFRD